ncbi:hypothetical protein RHMOL_Rhmol13G0057000 [Rhododendron molle]|uniref:Uncharacterized protein n=1 Tax=Rhododendron molle TaxID=49168 RepID=A0ACC0L3E1_RHOML|nr:hypothetical protein RHMOL_Rhmol13G0057000 [Rhododendron molle]
MTSFCGGIHTISTNKEEGNVHLLLLGRVNKIKFILGGNLWHHLLCRLLRYICMLCYYISPLLEVSLENLTTSTTFMHSDCVSAMLTKVKPDCVFVGF